jgi:hypothetical protein
MAERIRIGEILVRAGVIDEFQLKSALGEQARWGRRLGVTLIKLGFVEERDLVRALASQLSLPVASLEGKRISAEVLSMVPLEIAEKHMVIPLFVKRAGGQGTLYLGMEDPGNLEVLDDLSFRTGLQVKPVMVGPSELCGGIDRYYRDSRAGDTPGDKSSDAATPEVEQIPECDEVVFEDEAPEASPGAQRSVAPGAEELARHWTVDSDSAAEPSSPTTAPDAVSPTRPQQTDAEPVTAGGSPVLEKATAPESHVLDEAALSAPPARTDAPAPPSPQSSPTDDAKTRRMLNALAQLLIDKGVLTRDELLARVSDVSASEAKDA